MSFIIFLRHAQAVNNTKRLLAGRTDGVSLTQTGINQAQKMAGFIKPFNISTIYSSPIERAQKTAEIISKHNSIDYRIDERLNELDMGRFTGSLYDELFEKYGNVFLKFYQGEPIIEENDVEPFDKVKKRILDMVEHVMTQHNDENVVLVTHMDPIKAMISTIWNLTPNALFELIIENASLTIFKQEQGKLSLSAINVMDADRFDLTKS